MATKAHPTEPAVAAAQEICEARGLRLTRLRRRAVEALARAGKPVKAYDLLSSLGEGDAPAKPASAYRALDFLEEIGLVHRVSGLNAFILCAHGGGDHATSLYLCERCGGADERKEHLGPSDKAPAGFKVARSVIEHYGLCGTCARN